MHKFWLSLEIDDYLEMEREKRERFFLLARCLLAKKKKPKNQLKGALD